MNPDTALTLANRTLVLTLCSLLLTTGPSAIAQTAKPGQFDFGQREYTANCAGCHGSDGRGNGPYKPFLTRSPSDLTLLTRSNSGAFPAQRVHEVIDGRAQVRAHQGGDMPIWGADYLTKYAADYADVPYDPEAYVRTRITALVDYLNRIQAR
jgi:mono/diheme cytochrome c family protein